jgi:hypothetical protein
VLDHAAEVVPHRRPRPRYRDNLTTLPINARVPLTMVRRCLTLRGGLDDETICDGRVPPARVLVVIGPGE